MIISTIPFDIVFDVPLSFAGRQIELTLDMTSEDGLEEMADMFDCLCGLAGLGAFSQADVGNGASAAAWVSPATQRGARWQRTIAMHDVHVSFWRVLLQMCVQCHYHLAPIYRVAIRADDTTDRAADVRDVLSAPYLPTPRHMPFTVVGLDEAIEDAVAIRATTSVPIDDDVFETLKKAFDDWGSLVYVGGFAGADAPIEEFQLERVEVGRLHPALIECAAIGWNAPKVAIDHAVRMCGGLHYTTVPIVEVEVE